jgi:hypothetical protein
MATTPIRRYALVPEATDGRYGRLPPMRRFHLARVSGSPRSALGRDRHERMEEVARRNGPAA